MMLTTKNAYMVPRWCRMHPMDHFDGMGGCWGISHGCVAEQGRDYCRCCTFYRRVAERVDSFSAMGDAMASEARHRGKPFSIDGEH
jgi:hypothetical protein